MNVARVIMVFALLPLTVAIERFGYYLSRSMLWVHLGSVLGMDRATIGQLFTFQAIAAAGCALLGGLLAVAVGPAATLALGMLFSALGHVLLATSTSPVSAWVAAGLFGLGLGFLRPSTYALAASELRSPNEHLRNAAFVCLYAAANLAALLAPAAGGAVANATGTRAAFGAGAAVMALGLLASVALGVGFVLTRRKTEGEQAPSPALGRLLAGAAGLLVIGLVFTLLAGFVSSAEIAAFSKTGTSSASHSLVLSANPLAVLVTAAIVLAVSLALHFTRVRLSALFVVGVGACLAAAATLPLLLGGGSMAALYAASVLTGVAEVLVLPFALSRFSGDIPPRWVPLLLGAWVALTGGAAIAGNASSAWLPGSGTLLVAVTAGVIFLMGGALVLGAAPLARALYAPAQGET